MRQNFNKIEFAVGGNDILSSMPENCAFRIFDKRATGFLTALSSELLSLREAKTYADVVTFAFWCRKANLSVLSKLFENEYRLGRGIVFHIAPSNVPINFAYSLAAGMLAGNANVVRISSKYFEQNELVCKVISKILPQHPEINKRLCLIRYEHDKDITDQLSMMCMSRVIWGGDETVYEIRKSPLQARANEITFPDRYSICLINADKYLSEYDKPNTAKDFFNDTYLTDQNACTSPRIVIWFGERIDEAKSVFWAELYKHLGSYDLQPVQAVNKLTSFYKYASVNTCKLHNSSDNKIMRVEINAIYPEIANCFDNSGYFYEYNALSLDEIMPLLGRKYQTLSHIGFESTQLREFIMNHAPFGVDRIVPVGKTMDFSLIWDGVDLIRTLSREVSS